MNTHASVTKKLAAVVVAAATSASLGLSVAPADAAPVQVLAGKAAKPTKPVKLGPVTNLKATASKPKDVYRVSASWDSLTGATAYDVSLTAGTFTASARVTQGSWSTDVKAPVNTTVTVRVLPVTSDKSKPMAASTSVVLPDLTAPVGQYDLSLDDKTGTATVTEQSLSDDSGGVVFRFLDWGLDGVQQPCDGVNMSGWDAWTKTGTTTSYTYPERGRWEPRVCLVDEIGNHRVVTLKVVVTGDLTAPTGTFTTTPQKAWAKYSKVVLTQTALDDNVTPKENIVRVVDWHDGTTTAWTAGTTLTHVYQAGGSYTPSVQLTDEAGRKAEIASSPVTVRVDSTAPKVTIHVPARRVAYVDSWRKLRGTARDYVGTGVRHVHVNVVEKRGATWYAYRAPGKRWVVGGSTRASAMRKTRAAVATWKAGRWTTSVARLRKGTIVVKATAVDRVGNTAKPVLVSRKLTK